VIGIPQPQHYKVQKRLITGVVSVDPACEMVVVLKLFWLLAHLISDSLSFLDSRWGDHPGMDFDRLIHVDHYANDTRVTLMGMLLARPSLNKAPLEPVAHHNIVDCVTCYLHVPCM
jgi:hypothetical protein